MSTKDTESSEEIKEQIEETLAKAESDLKEIERRLTPGYFIDNLIYKNRSPNPMSTVELLYDRPIGTTFLALGTFMLSERPSDRKSGEEIFRDAAENLKEATKEGAIKAKKSVEENLAHGKDKIRQASHKMGEEMSSLSHKASEYTETTKQTMKAAKGKLQKKAHDMLEASSDISPIALASLGLGLGAAIGTSLPELEKEQTIIESNKSDLAELRKDIENTIKLSVERTKNSLADELKAIRFA